MAVTDPSALAERRQLAERVHALIEEVHSARNDAARDEVLLAIARWQARRVEPYARLCASRGLDPGLPSLTLDSFPAIPTDVFRYRRVAAHREQDDHRVFLTSGTRSGDRGAHHLHELGLYDHSARVAAAHSLFPEGVRIRLISLVPTPQEAPESSLSYMVDRFGVWFGAGDMEVVWKDGLLDLEHLIRALDQAVADGQATALLGTSFALVHAEEGLRARTWTLPSGSRIMQTGGFKGRSREVDSEELRRSLTERYGVDPSWIIAEYSMAELSSQTYETTLREAWAGISAPVRRLAAPPWVRRVVCDPETLVPMTSGCGLLRIEDPANLDTAWAVQTSDLAEIVAPDGFVLLGRAPGAVLRGCSLAVEEALGR
jgi:hypothetical protein